MGKSYLFGAGPAATLCTPRRVPLVAPRPGPVTAVCPSNTVSDGHHFTFYSEQDYIHATHSFINRNTLLLYKNVRQLKKESEKTKKKRG